MNLLFDENLSWKLAKRLNTYFPGCVHISDIHTKLKPFKDRDIWEYATQNNFAIVTYDEDFYDLQMLLGFPPKIIWLRTGNLTNNEVITKLASLKDKIQHFLDNNEEGILEIY
jgi:predicted nuclease of predicted toxin-antitoxin system